MIFPIKKIINTELFIGGKQGFYIQKEQIKKLSDLFEEGELKLAKFGVNTNK